MKSGKGRRDGGGQSITCVQLQQRTRGSGGTRAKPSRKSVHGWGGFQRPAEPLDGDVDDAVVDDAAVLEKEPR